MSLWQVIIPTSMLRLGGWLLLLSFVVQILIPQNSKTAIWFALIGGFGVGGGVGGWFGQALAGATHTAATFTDRWTAQLVGTGFGFLLFAILALFVWRFAGRGGAGLKTKGKGKGAKAKQILWLLAFAMLGTALAGLPQVYGWANTAVSAAGHAVIAALP